MLLEIISKANAGKAYEQAEKFRAGKQAIVNRCKEFAKNHEVALGAGGILSYVVAISKTAMSVSPTAAPIIVGLGIGLPVLAGAAAKTVDVIRNKISARKASER